MARKPSNALETLLRLGWALVALAWSGSATAQGVVPMGIIDDDGRVPSSYAAVGRVVGSDGTVLGTAFLLLNGALVTAAHVPPYRVEFQVPLSEADGTPRHPAPEHVYPVDLTSVQEGVPGDGRDWKVFRCLPNAVTGDDVLDAQGEFLRVAYGLAPPSAVLVVGYGKDCTPDVYGGCAPNASSHAQQMGSGAFVGVYYLGDRGYVLRHDADTESGNSGSPILMPDGATATGVHAQGPLTPYCEGHNCGPSFLNLELRDAVSSFSPAGALYLDSGHPATVEDGSLFQPYHALARAVGNAPSHSVLTFAPGHYSAPAPMVVAKPIRLVAPLGGVVLGQ
jgi:hypothetical protein